MKQRIHNPLFILLVTVILFGGVLGCSCEESVSDPLENSATGTPTVFDTVVPTSEQIKPSGTPLKPVSLNIAVSSGVARSNIVVYEVSCTLPGGGCAIQFHQLTDDNYTDGFAMVSPDRQSIAFMTNRVAAPAVVFDVYTMAIDGSGLFPLSNELDYEEFPQWSSAGTKLAITTRTNGSSFISILSVDGRERHDLENPMTWSFRPVWSPDDEWIAFLASTEGPTDPYSHLYVMKPDGSEQQRLTEIAEVFQHAFPSWSPDGTSITYSASTDREEPFDIYAVDVATGVKTRLTNDTSINRAPVWSPSGKEIAFVSYRDGSAQIYLMSADGSGLRRWSNSSPANDIRPLWSPDGNYIVFTSDRDGHNQVYLGDYSGEQTERITFTDKEEWADSIWSP